MLSPYYIEQYTVNKAIRAYKEQRARELQNQVSTLRRMGKAHSEHYKLLKNELVKLERELKESERG